MLFCWLTASASFLEEKRPQHLRQYIHIYIYIYIYIHTQDFQSPERESGRGCEGGGGYTRCGLDPKHFFKKSCTPEI